MKDNNLGAAVHGPNARTSMTPERCKKLQAKQLRADFSLPTLIYVLTLHKTSGNGQVKLYCCDTKLPLQSPKPEKFRDANKNDTKVIVGVLPCPSFPYFFDVLACF